MLTSHRLSIQCPFNIQVYYTQPWSISIVLGLCDWHPFIYASVMPYGYVCIQLTKEGGKLLQLVDILLFLVYSSWPHSYGFLYTMKLLGVAHMYAIYHPATGHVCKITTNLIDIGDLLKPQLQSRIKAGTYGNKTTMIIQLLTTC